MGKYIAAGLPGITGTSSSLRAYNVTGSFYKFGSQGYNHGSGMGGESLGFDASLSSSIYSASDTVQPPTVKLAPSIYLGKLA